MAWGCSIATAKIVLGALGRGTTSAKQHWWAWSSLPSVRLVRAPNELSVNLTAKAHTYFGLRVKGRTRHKMYVALNVTATSFPGWNLSSPLLMCVRINPTDQQSANAFSRRDKQGTPEQSLKLSLGWHHTVAFSPIHLLLGGGRHHTQAVRERQGWRGVLSQLTPRSGAVR